MSSLGATFRREREARNLTLEEVAAKTRIGIRLLRAIEAEQFERLPGGIFNISFVRQYARMVGLDEELAIREYLQAVGAGREAVPAERTRPPEPPASFERVGYFRILVAAVVVGVLAAGIAYGLYRLHAYLTAAPSSGEGRADPTLALATPPEPVPAPVEGLPEFPAEEGSAAPEQDPTADLAAPFSLPSPRSVSSAPSSAAVPLGSTPIEPSEAVGHVPVIPEKLVLRIDSHGPVWLSITADGVKQWQGTLRANQSRAVQATESVRLTVGDAAAVALTLNGRPLPALGRPGEVKNLTITAKTIPESAP